MTGAWRGMKRADTGTGVPRCCVLGLAQLAPGDLFFCRVDNSALPGHDRCCSFTVSATLTAMQFAEPLGLQ